MRKASDEAGKMARYINTFLNEYVLSQKSSSSHTLKSYSDALSLYIGFLESEKSVHTANLSAGLFGRTYMAMAILCLSICVCSPSGNEYSG